MENLVSSQITHDLIIEQLRQWRIALENNRISMLVTEAIGDSEDRKEAIRKDSTRCVKAIEFLNSELSKLNES